MIRLLVFSFLFSFLITVQAQESLDINLKAGDTIQLPKSEYNDVIIVINGNGTASNPCIISGKKNAVLIKGQSQVYIVGNYVQLVDIDFTDIRAVKSNAVINFSYKGRDCSNCTISNISIKNSSNMNDRSYCWIIVSGKNNVIKNSFFEGKENRSPIIHVNIDKGQVANHQIINCEFSNVEPRVGDALEAIRLGGGNGVGNCLVSKNRFVNYKGDSETISNKSDSNTFSGNTFINCRSGISIRTGNSCKIIDNVFVKTRNSIRLTGEGHIIEGNIFESLTPNKSQGGAIIFMLGSNLSKGFDYKTVKNTVVRKNLFINNTNIRMLKANAKYDVWPSNLTFEGNQFLDPKKQLYSLGNFPFSMGSNKAVGKTEMSSFFDVDLFGYSSQRRLIDKTSSGKYSTYIKLNKDN